MGRRARQSQGRLSASEQDTEHIDAALWHRPQKFMALLCEREAAPRDPPHLDYDTLRRELPEEVGPAYDAMSLELPGCPLPDRKI